MSTPQHDTRAADIRNELENTRRAYHHLLATIPDHAWQRPTTNPAWNVRQMMYHITLALRFLPADVAAMRSGRIPPVPPWLFNRVNEWFTRLAGNRHTRASLAAEYDRRHHAVLRLLDTIGPHEWELSAQYPHINQNLSGTRTLASMFHYLTTHFHEHAADIQPALTAEPEASPRLASRPPHSALTRSALGRSAIGRSAIGRSFLRLPVTLYHLGFGWLLGPRFLLLQHTGRISGLPRHAVLEVTAHDRQADIYTVASGFGHSSQWFKNVQANPHVTIQVGPRRIAARARVLSPEESARKMVDYARRHPYAARILARVLGHQTDGSAAAYAAIGRRHMPFVAFHPQRIIRHTPTRREWAGLALTILTLIAAITLLLRRLSRR